MTRGFLRGTASGLVLCLVALTLATIAGGPPQSLPVDVAQPEDASADAVAVPQAVGVPDDELAVVEPSPLTRAAPEPDTLGGVGGEAGEPSGTTAEQQTAGAPSPSARSLGDAPSQPALPEAVPAESAFAPVAVPPAHENREAAVVPDASFRPEVSTDIMALRAPDATPPATAFSEQPATSEPRRPPTGSEPSDAAPRVAAEPPRQPVSALETAPPRIAVQDDPAAAEAAVETGSGQGRDGGLSVMAMEAPSMPVASSEPAVEAADPPPGGAGALHASKAPAMAVGEAAGSEAASDAEVVSSVLVLVDDGSGPSDASFLQDVLADMPFPVAIAVDPLHPDAGRRAQIYRASGHDVLLLLSGPVDGPTVEMTRRLRARLDGIPDAAGVLARGPASLEALDWLAREVAGAGLGLLVQGDAMAPGPQGDGVPGDLLRELALSASDQAGAAVIWSDLPPGSGVRKGQPVAVVMPLDADTVAALLRDAPSIFAAGVRPVALADILSAARP